MDLKHAPYGRMLRDFRHGGHAIVPTEEAEAEAREALGAGADDAPVAESAAAVAARDETVMVVTSPYEPIEDEDFYKATTRFDYVFSELITKDNYAASHLPTDDAAKVVEGLTELGRAMVEQDPEPALDSPIPAIYTYWGQFIDHDLTANTDRDEEISNITVANLKALPPDHVRTNLRNLRHPALNLDSVYGDGPTFAGRARTHAADLYHGPKLRVGTVATAGPIPGVLIPPDDDLNRDLPRLASQAQIGDGRNDENLIVAQLHTAFLRFHNAVVDWVREHEPEHDTGHDADERVFWRARQLTEWHYQWLVVNDYLKTVTKRGTVGQVLSSGGDPRFAPRDGDVFMPLEFSVAAFRFGHSMVRRDYDYNRNFGRPGLADKDRASFERLFEFTGGFELPDGRPFLSVFGGQIPFNWIIEWDRFVDKGSTFADRFARRIDTLLAPPLTDMVKEGESDEIDKETSELLKHLARRNLLRAYHLSIPTGQAVADAMGVDRLAAADLAEEDSELKDVLEQHGFIERTPLWYYLLREAEEREGGKTLGELGSRLVCETIIGQVHYDPTSYLRQEHPWSPEQGVRLADGTPITSIREFLRFAGVLA
jgi:hypothetical protein